MVLEGRIDCHDGLQRGEQTDMSMGSEVLQLAMNEGTSTAASRARVTVGGT